MNYFKNFVVFTGRYTTLTIIRKKYTVPYTILLKRYTNQLLMARQEDFPYLYNYSWAFCFVKSLRATGPCHFGDAVFRFML